MTVTEIPNTKGKEKTSHWNDVFEVKIKIKRKKRRHTSETRTS
jgi:hypothetical protein